MQQAMQTPQDIVIQLLDILLQVLLQPGYGNTALGRLALRSNTGNLNVAVGYQSLHDNTSASENTAIGTDSGRQLTTGNANVCVGADSMEFSTTASHSTAVGHDANRYNSTGINCTYVGQAAGMGTNGSTTGYNNTGIGKSALNDITTGHDNCAVGSFAADNLTTGSDNTYVGDNAGNTHATGSACTFVGRANNGSANDVSNETFWSQRHW